MTMPDEHDDDLEPEAEVGAEIETQDYAGAAVDDAADAGDVDAARAEASDESDAADDSLEPADEDEASDTI